MTVERHLVLQELILLPSAEWSARADGWLVLRVAEGAGYWILPQSAHDLNAGDMLVAPRHSTGLIRVSSLGPLRLQYFYIQPRLLNGLLAIVDGQQLETNAANGPVHALVWPARDPLAQRFAEILTQPIRTGLPLRCRLLLIWADAVAGFIRQSGEASDPLDLRDRFRQLLSEMSQAELSACSLGDLAAQLHCSERHLSRLFREEFGTPFRERQTELRLLRAQQILEDSNAKIINVALESGYRHLGLFNTMFKKRFGMTPSQWRLKAAKKTPRAIAGLLCFALSFWTCPAVEPTSLNPDQTPKLYLDVEASPEAIARAREALHRKLQELADEANGITNRPPEAVNDPGPKFEVRRYEVTGNTLLSSNTINEIFADAKGTNVSLAQIRRSLADLQTAYRERGYPTVVVTLPQQQLTNASVAVQVTEAPITVINVVNNHYFSSNNVMSAFPSLRDIYVWTNVMLNSQVFQRELDQANANRDRQIYPILGPGPDVGTSELTLKVKDRLPLHARAELNNQYTPGTPQLRMNVNASYGNLWNLEHQLGVQYSFTPEDTKPNTDYNSTPFDDPLIANYSAYYRMPIGSVASVQDQIEAQPLNFGYNEATRQFQLPPASGRPDFTLYASRSTSDTGVKYQKANVVAQTPLITIVSQDSGEDITLNEGFGGALSVPLPQKAGIRSTLSLGFDYKRYQLTSFNTNNFYITTVITNSSGSQTITDKVSSGQPTRHQFVEYFPLNAGLNLAIPGYGGTTFVNVSANFNPLNVFSGDGDFINAAGNTNAVASYFRLLAGATREVKLYQDWSALIHADGQWTDGPLISNEQFAMGGLSGVRGYLDAQAYGDSGWRMQVEPRTPLIKLGMVDGDIPFWIRASVFWDFGQLYNFHGEEIRTTSYEGVGTGLTATIGDHLDGRITLAWPLMDAGGAKSGDMHIYFGLGAQF